MPVMSRYTLIGLMLLGAPLLTAAQKPALSMNARTVRDINRKDGRLKFPAETYADNIAFVFNGVPLYESPRFRRKNRVTLKRGQEALLQIIDGNDNVDEPPLGPMFLIDCRQVDFGMRTQDERVSIGSHDALQLWSVRPETGGDPGELQAFVIWVSAAAGDPGEYPASMRLVFRDGTKLHRNFTLVLK